MRGLKMSRRRRQRKERDITVDLETNPTRVVWNESKLVGSDDQVISSDDRVNREDTPGLLGEPLNVVFRETFDGATNSINDDTTELSSMNITVSGNTEEQRQTLQNISGLNAQIQSAQQQPNRNTLDLSALGSFVEQLSQPAEQQRGFVIRTGPAGAEAFQQAVQQRSQQLSSYTFDMMDFSTAGTSSIVIDYEEELLQFVKNILK